MGPHAEPAGTGAYPPSWETDVVLRDGLTVRVRPIVPDDAERLVRFHSRQSAESIYLRYFSPRPVLTERDIHHFTHVDHRDRVAFVALSEGEIVGVARYERYGGTKTAEVAFFVDDDQQGRGLATLLLEYLAAAGRENGLRRFTATTLPQNRKMLRVFTAAGYDAATTFDDGVVEVAFDIGPTDEALAAIERRERRAEAASVRRMLQPASVAVIGVGRNSGGLGADVFRNLVANGFRGTVFAVNRDAARAGEQVQGVRAFASIEEVPSPVDLAIVAVPAAEVPDVVHACGRRGVGGVAVLSAGFSEYGAEGAALEERTVEAARLHGIRLLGPNALGIVNTDQDVRLDATLVPELPPSGPIGMLAESGLLSAAIIDHAVRSDLGMSTFVAAGNRADVAATDLLSYWIADERTEAVLLYLAARSLPPRFVRAARAASMDMPIAALHTAMSGGADARTSSRSALEEADRRARAVFRQTGVIRVDSLGQLFDLGRVLTDQPVPQGRGVVVVGNSAGAVALASDACIAAGLELVPVELPDADGRSLTNPIDLTYRAGAEDYARVLAAVTADPDVHSVVVIHTPPRVELDHEVIDVLVAASNAAPDTTIVATVLGASDMARLASEGAPRAVPVFRFPEDAAHALGRLATYRSWRRSADKFGLETPSGSDPEAARSLVEAALERREPGDTDDLALDHEEQERLLAFYQVAMVPRRVVHDVGEAVDAAAELGWPVVLKADTRNRLVRSTASGVALDLVDPEQLRVTWERMEQLLGVDLTPAVVQRFVEQGIDAAVTVTRRPDGAATVEVGLGGPAAISGMTELGVLPLSLAAATALVANSPLGRVLTDPLDRVRLVELVHRLAALVDGVEEVHRVHADPVLVSGSGAAVADVEIVVGDPDDELLVRRIE